MASVVYKTHCDLCMSSFNSTTALLRHRLVKHRKADWVLSLPFYKGDEVVQLPPRSKKGRRSTTYKQWLGGIIDSINSCLHPKPPGKWCRVESYDIPKEFFQAMLGDMPNAFVNSVREKRHLRPPVWRFTCQVAEYKDYNIGDIIDALEKRSGVKLQCKKAYQGDKEIISEIHEKSGRTALEAAKARAHFVVGIGEGRATREFGLLWWPDMFSSNTHGKLTLGFFVSKVNFS
ncbi:uncharacterized protein [Montipora foliosa]|uniref:uncharacterized protein n=1 Tax=Montipora foliosa TaxID=591990 RepID=UPI0035F208F4